MSEQSNEKDGDIDERARSQRAADLRKRISDIAAGRTGSAPSDREFTDKAAAEMAAAAKDKPNR